MIKGLMGGKGLTVLSGNNSLQYVNQNTTNPMQGMIRVWGTDMQVFDGSVWQNIQSSYATVELNGEVQSIIQWAREERDKQLARTRLVRDNPALQKALESIQKAEANFDILAKFVENDKEEDSVQASP